MCQSNMNKLMMMALLGALILAVVFISGCIQVPEEKPGEGQPSVTTLVTTPTEKSDDKIITDIIKEEYKVYAWSPDRKKIAYINMYDNLIVINVDGTNKIRLVPVGGKVPIRWSSDSKRIVYGCCEQINIDGTGRFALSMPDDPYGEGKRIVSLSPDGKMIAYQNASGKSWQSMRYSLVVVAADDLRNVITRVAAGKSQFAYVSKISWSPDVKRILYYVSGLDGDGYHILDVSNGKVSYIGDVGKPEWSPDGKKLVYLSSNNVYVINADGTGKINLGEGEGPKWSSDSKKIVYTYTEKFGKEVTGRYTYVVNADGTGKVKLTEGQNPIPSPATQ